MSETFYESIIDDHVALRITELLIDKYHFHDTDPSCKNHLEKNGFLLVDQSIKDELEKVSSQELVKILGAIYKSIKRHNNGGREYIDFIRQHVGVKIGKGVRMILG